MTGSDDADRTLPFSRREFVRLSAATAGALALPGNATASAEAEAMTATYQYLTNHTPVDHAVPTLVTFADADGPSAMVSAVESEVITTTEPEPAAYAELTTAEAVRVADLPSADALQFSPGSNPFWRIGYYPFGVFPEPRRSVDFIGFEQLKDGLRELEERYPDRVRVKDVGSSPGHPNQLTDRPDPKEMLVVELTNFESEADFEEKETVFFSCSLHGLERAGAETGARVAENVARGSEPDIEGNEEKIEPYLDDTVVVLGFTNPDGWVARNPQYESGWQFFGPDGGAPGAPLYERGSAGVYDTNRQYPSVGYIVPPPGHYPAEPKGANHVDDDDGIDTDAPDYVRERVPDAAALIEHFRGYENLNYGADLHGGPIFNEFVLGLISQDQFDTRDLHELYEMCLNIDDTLEAALEKWVTAGNLKQTLLGDRELGLPFGVLPEQAFDYSTIYDTIGYTVSGAFLDWMSHPEELGGLGMTTLDFEMAFSHLTGGNVYNPELLEMEVTGYRTAIRTITAFAVRNSDTPTTDDSFEARTETGGDAVAYVTTGTVGDPEEDLLCRTDEQLQFGEPVVADARTYTGAIGPGTFAGPTTATTEHSFDTADVPDSVEEVRAALSWEPAAQDLEFVLKDPDGLTVASARSPTNPERVDAVLRKDGEYTFVVETWANAAASYEIEAEFLAPPDGASGGSTETDGQVTTTTLAADAVAVETVEVSGSDVHSMGVHVHAQQAFLDVELVSPDGETVHSFDAVAEDRAGGKCCGLPEWQVAAPEAGTWTVRLRNRGEDAKRAEIQFWTLSSSLPNPDPEEAVGYEQRSYTVSPLRFFEDYGEAADGELTPVTVEEVVSRNPTDGLFEPNGERRYDHVVVTHDHDADGFAAALDRFVDAGGNLVVTDTATYLLRRLDNDLVSGAPLAPRTAIQRRQYAVARYTDKDLSHPLMTDVRPIQDQLWKVAPLGYSVSGEAPMYLLDPEALEAAASGTLSVAGSTEGLVATASITEGPDSGRGIHVISSLLPPASQRNLHPFGLLDYTVTFLGYLVFTSALGFEQVRETKTTTRRYGRGDAWDFSGESDPEDGGVVGEVTGAAGDGGVSDAVADAEGDTGLTR